MNSDTIAGKWTCSSGCKQTTGKRSYLGPFGNSDVRLQCERLPEHDTLVVSMRMYILGSWDGITDSDQLIITIDQRDTLLHSTFSNTTYLQNYPDRIGGKSHPRRTGAAETDVTGWIFREAGVFDGPLDAAYTLEFRLPHSAASCALAIRGVLRDVRKIPENEAWGIDDVHIGVIRARKPERIPEEDAVRGR